jgi:hypothetical protein
MKAFEIPRIALSAIVMVCAVAVGIPASASPSIKQAPKTVVVLVDVSKSISSEDRMKAYRESFSSAITAIRPRDRLVIGPLGANDRSTWSYEFDAVFPPGSGVKVADDRASAGFKKKAAAAFDALMERGEKRPDTATRIADAIDAASEAFTRDPANARVLLILSDMEESGSKPVKHRKAPASLEGASVHVAGAGGGQRYSEIETAWRTYFSTARGAELAYGRFPARLAK